MRTRWLAPAVLLLAAFPGARGGAGVAWAQSAPLGNRLSVSLETGGRAYLEELPAAERGKFEEYREVRSGGFLQALSLGLLSPDGRFQGEAVAREIGERDQLVRLRVQDLGRFDLQLRWDRIPHTYSTTARFSATETQRGVYTLPTPRPDTAALNRARLLGAVRLQWDAVRLGLAINPRKDWGFKAEYTRIEKNGERPLGMTVLFRPQEVPEPIEQTVHDLKLTQGFYRQNMQLQFSYDLSVFRNELDRVVADYPFNAVDDPNAGGARQRTALAPDNLAHSLGLAGGVSLPAKTRISGGLSYGWRRQDQTFLPHTINSAIAADPSLTLAQPDLAADARLLRFHLVANSRPLDRLNLTARYRYFDFDDRTQELEFPARVGYGDGRLIKLEHPLTAHRLWHSRQIAGVDGSYRLVPGVQLKAGYGWEQAKRNPEAREVGKSDEHTTKAALDFTGIDWLLLRASYGLSWRRGDPYHEVVEEVLPELRRLDIADRDRERVELLGRLYPLEGLTISAAYSRGLDEYPESAYGLQRDQNWSASGEVSWTPLDRLELYAGYARDQGELRQRSRYREPAVPSNTSFDWVGNSGDRITTYSAGGSLVLLPDRLDLGASWDYSRSVLRMHAFNPTPPAGGTAAQIRSATATNFPTIEQKLMPLSAYLRYSPAADWALTLRYAYEKFEDTDFRTDGLYPAITNAAFLGQEYRDYNAHLLSVTVGFRPALLRPARSTL